MAPIFTAQIPLLLAHTILNTTNTTASPVTPTATVPSLSTVYPKQYLFKNTYNNLNLHTPADNPTTTLSNTTIISLTLLLLLLALAETIAFLLLIALVKRCVLNARAKDRARREQMIDRAGREGQEWSEPWEDEGLLATEPEDRFEGVVMEWGRSRRMV
jgi:hypothetical protein